MGQNETNGDAVYPSVDREAFRWAGKQPALAGTAVHVYGKYKAVCATDSRGHERPRGASKLDLLVDASEGFIPLWGRDVTLRWRFNQFSLEAFEQPDAAAAAVRLLLGKGVEQWGEGAPVKLSERDDAYDFEIAIREADRCSVSGCVLASAFFPDPGRHELKIYPKFFELDETEQVETMAHELGHVFGLRHFFALISETRWPSEVFGEHDASKPFSIMNYGAASTMTDADRRDLKLLYEGAWSGQLREINGTPVRLMRPYHEAQEADRLVALTALLRTS
ncbi:hypothetical protein [Pseudoduganella dura]|uniref:hypothetical protein n=1 Tax=Pseudoduganella dura TaxID=321982 RepID=UPI00198E937B|nr:hypothetical protein [Pseudoduganella dura]GGX97726.1 matrix metalloproteinase-11 [Pseudoduganella dura]